MSDIKSSFWAEALIRRARLGGAFAYLRRHGDDDAGIVVLKIALMDGRAIVLMPERDENFSRIWVPQTKEAQTEAEADLWIEKAIHRDPDLWVVEIEDPQGRDFLLPEERPPLDES